MPWPALVTFADLFNFDGFPFNEDLVSIAAASVRSEAGWHIAPVVTETLQVTSYGGQLLPLPTRRIVTITQVRGSDAVAITGWTKMSMGVYRKSGWPIDVLSVDLTHGYDETPADLLPIVVQRVKATSVPSNVSQRSTTTGPFAESETYRDVSSRDPVVSRYAVLPGVA
jgi:hypothetical protein